MLHCLMGVWDWPLSNSIYLSRVWVNPLVEMIWPRNVTDSAWNSHFSALTNNWFSNRRWRTCVMCRVCNWREVEKIDKLINHVTQNNTDQTPENGQSIGKTKQKNQIFVVS